jgi:hypothetical protein
MESGSLSAIRFHSKSAIADHSLAEVTHHYDSLGAPASGYVVRISQTPYTFSAHQRLSVESTKVVLPRIPKSRRYAADGSRDGAVHMRRIFAGALAAQHVHLNQVHGIDVRVAELD